MVTVASALFAGVLYWAAKMWFEAMTPQQLSVRQVLRQAATNAGLDPDLIDAIAYVESQWNPLATNNTGNDAERGGAWGATQITLETAQGVGYTGTGAGLLDVNTAAALTAKIMAGRPNGPPTTIEDAAAWWNAGVKSAAQAPASTTLKYIPAAQKALAFVQANPVDEA